MYWTYTAITSSGQEVTSTLYGHKKDILRQISDQRYFLIEVHVDYQRTIMNLLKKNISTLSLAVFFEDFSNMLQTGMNINQILLILKETSKEEALSRALCVLEEKLRQGHALTESVRSLNVFPWVVPTTLSAGEKTGRLTESTGILGKYFRNSHQIRNKLQQALIYPAIILVLLLTVMFFISVRVIPQLRNLLPADALHNQTTQWILFASGGLQQYGLIFLIFLFLGTLGLFFLHRKYRYYFQEWMYRWPILGNILKESAFAIYLLNLSVFLKSGVGLLKSIEDLNILDPTPVSNQFFKSREYILGGSSFWQSIEQNRFFPLIISSTLRRAEEMVKVDEYCLSLSEHFQRRVDSKIDGLLHFIQPALLAFGGMFLVIIALAFLLPVYGNLTTIAEGK